VSTLFAAWAASLSRHLGRREREPGVLATQLHFASFMEHLPGLAWMKDLDGRYVFANEAAVEVFRKSRAELYGRTDLEIFPPATAAQFQANDRLALVNDGLQTTETLRHADGTLHQAVVNKFPIRDPDGRPALIGGIAIDITDRLRAESQLRDTEARKAAMLDMALDCIVTIDHEGRIVEFNPAAERSFGYRREDVIGEEMCELIIPQPLRDAHRAGLGRNVATGEARVLGKRLELDALRADGSEFPVELAITCITSDGPPLYTAFLRDITDRKRNEQALRDADRRKDEFLATLAHELRNPLAPVRNAVQLLRLEGPHGPGLEWARDVIDRQVEHLTRLIDDLLDVSRITRDNLELRKEPVALSEVIRGAVETSRPLMEQHGHELIVSLPRADVYLNADLVRLSQVFMNLLSNAAKYTDPGGCIRLTAERGHGGVVVRVRDNGVGIAADKLEHLFDLFFQGDNSLERPQSGLGIGLSLAQRLVELHGGRIEARSEGPGRGSEFIVRLAAVEEPPVAPEPVEDDGDAVPEPVARRILVADDNRDAADSLGLLLQLSGNAVRIAYGSQEALRLADEFRPDTALLDIGMPEMNGCDLARSLRGLAWGERILLIAVTGWGQEEDRRRTREAGFDAHLVKPVDHAVLLRLLADPPRARVDAS